MSGVVKGVKKVFKGVGKVIKKVAKPLAIAALAVYTGGLAMGAMGMASGASAAAGGGGFFGGLFGAGATGANFFSALRTAGTSAIQGWSQGGSIFGKVAGSLFGTGGFAGGGGAADVLNSGAGTGGGGFIGAATEAAAAQGLIPKGGQMLAQNAAKKGLFSGFANASTTDKLLMANLGISAISGLTAPKLSKQYDEAKRFRGSFYGSDGGEPVGPTERMNDRFPQPRRLFVGG